MLRLPDGAKHLDDRGASAFVSSLELLTQQRLSPIDHASAAKRFQHAAAVELNPSLAVVIGLWLEDRNLKPFALLVESLLLPGHTLRRRMNGEQHRIARSAASAPGVGEVQRPLQQSEARLRGERVGKTGWAARVSRGNRPGWMARPVLGEE